MRGRSHEHCITENPERKKGRSLEREREKQGLKKKHQSEHLHGRATHRREWWGLWKHLRPLLFVFFLPFFCFLSFLLLRHSCKGEAGRLNTGGRGECLGFFNSITSTTSYLPTDLLALPTNRPPSTTTSTIPNPFPPSLLTTNGT